MPSSALEQGASAVLVGRIEQEVERGFEPVRHFMLVRLKPQIGRYCPEYRCDDVTGDGAVGLE